MTAIASNPVGANAISVPHAVHFRHYWRFLAVSHSCNPFRSFNCTYVHIFLPPNDGFIAQL